MSKENIKRGVFNLIGARNYAKSPRQEDDYYATDPESIDRLEKRFKLPNAVWECACGEGNLSKRLRKLGHKVFSTDLVDRGWGKGGVDFLKKRSMPPGCTAIVTNPPYSIGCEFVTIALSLVPKSNGVVAMFVKTQFLESQQRYNEIFRDNPPQYMYQFVSRMRCYKNNDQSQQNSAMPFCWLVWDNSEKARRKRAKEEDTTRIYWI